MSLSADDFRLDSKSAYIPKCINISRLFPEKKISMTYIRLFTTFITLNKRSKKMFMRRETVSTKK